MTHFRIPFLKTAAASALALGLAAPALAADMHKADKNMPAADRTAAQGQAGASSSQATADYRALRASNIIGKSVRGSKGENIGQIEDLIINTRTGDVRYAMLSFDPGIFEGEELYAVPTSKLRMTRDGDDLSYDISRGELERVRVDRDQWGTALRDRSYLDKVDKVYGINETDDKTARAFPASDLIGKDVKSRNGEDIGEVKDLVINMNKSKVHYAAVSFDPGWATPESVYTVPMSSFRLSRDNDDVVLDIDKSQVKNMKHFDNNRWANLNDRVWVADVDHYLIGVTAPRNSPASMFSRLDTDKNGSLSEKEAKANTGVHAAWKQLDKDGNGRISREEFTSNYKTSGMADTAQREGAGAQGSDSKS